MKQINDTRERILSAAGELISSRSYENVGVAEICAAASVKKGSFYHFFPSKRDLTVAVLEAMFVDFKHQLLDEAFRPEYAPLERIDRLAQMVYEFQSSTARDTGRVPGCPFGNMAAEQATQDEVLRAKVSGLFEQLAGAIRGAVQQAVEQGDLPPLDVAATAEAMLAYAEGVMLLGKTRNDAGVIQQLLPAMRDIRIGVQPPS